MNSIKTIGSYTAFGFGVGGFMGIAGTVKSMSDTRWPNAHRINMAGYEYCNQTTSTTIGYLACRSVYEMKAITIISLVAGLIGGGIGFIAGIREVIQKKSNISLDDVEKLVIGSSCAESWPCQHQSIVFLKDGRKVSGLNSYDICSIVSNIAQERINPGEKWNAKAVKEHFLAYSKSRPEMEWKAESPDVVLNKIFSRK